ncbi:uncharacterized protein [Palaemon carinicauda]|uniref:uncharacterized protein n=1 Tax=Palaemon carinicauda TaxID=392227 RepID=UPI0035B671A6
MNLEGLYKQLFAVLIYARNYECRWISDENANYIYVKDRPRNNYDPTQLEDMNINYDNVNSYLDEWTLDEEYIINPTRKSSLKQVMNTFGDQWWRITNPDDPANNAEPALWDGHSLQKPSTQNIFADYQLMQDNWEEEAVT